MKRCTIMFWVGYGLIGMASLVLCMAVWKNMFPGTNLANGAEARLLGMGFGMLGAGSGLAASAFSLLSRPYAAGQDDRSARVPTDRP
ncbi:hypothetical protein [Acetobacter sp.]|jgi:hypothetical protein|uniref:hypothetical protein n=1 Tax=Acetobacter sp. TaxID=440 RepID=UPI0025C6AB6F|nr:hypothetical protein [Acetobacter sp.]MCH4091522.1 hypothetical protein [Acetobacter sp.]MCI1299500.1 hypothetical protein [Acetobacter sp.]MCI1316910.1 hypothetical protein [Acetobacter sp.]